MSAWIKPSLLIIMSPLGESRVETVGGGGGGEGLEKRWPEEQRSVSR